ncbi:hypothetical protein ABMY20_15310 [Tenacibaculum sp. SSH1-16]|uniref:hypothetical protein n=1 Tax=Tenacibaculum sp. SSH1-16 TaxID=3136667 RepID=UPI0032C417C1|nr:hypothetical protein BACY1_20820 [Tenacibaculum mesophilum]
MKHQPQKVNDSFRILTIETIGNILIYLSGILPFVHVLVKDEPLNDKFLGYTSIHRFLYSAGTHSSLLFVTIGILILVTFLDNENISHFKKTLKFSLLSPLVSATFFMSWVVIPDVDFNLIAYIFIGLCISGFSVFSILRFLDYVKLVKIKYIYKEQLLDKGLEFVESSIKQ